MRFIFVVLFLIAYFSYGFEIKWRSTPDQYQGIKLKLQCGDLKVYEKKDSFNGFSPDTIYYYFYLDRLYKISLKYKSFYRFVQDQKKITGKERFSAIDILTYEKNDTVIKIIHTPFKNVIQFIYRLYYPRVDLIEKCN